MKKIKCIDMDCTCIEHRKIKREFGEYLFITMLSIPVLLWTIICLEYIYQLLLRYI